MSEDYKKTLNLPRTEFPMKAGLAAREPQQLATWEKESLYQRIQQARQDAPLFVLHDGPPFANGDVHMGTALNKILKDIIVKSKTMAGFRAPFVPGWDCHGLPIEFKVVKEKAGLSPVEVRKRSEAYARKYIDLQREQFRRLGVFGDWEHPYLTLDPSYEADILRAFSVFVEKGLVYRSKRPVLWSYGAQTALAEAEVEYKDKESPAVHVAFPVVRGKNIPQDAAIVIWTTTPWTLPANLAIAVSPKHEYALQTFSKDGTARLLVMAADRVQAFVAETGWQPQGDARRLSGADLEGTVARHPFLDRESPVFGADFVTMDTGTGCVHIAPGHGADDFHLGKAKGLEILCPVDDLGCFTAECGVGAWVGKQVFETNPLVVDHLRSTGALLGASPYRHSYPHCWRSKTPIIFRTVEQFFIRIDDLRPEAIKAINNTRWIPDWGLKRITGTVESRPDWCISRQRSWGVPLPVFYSAQGEPILDAGLILRVADLVEKRGTNAWFEMQDAELAAMLGLPAGTTKGHDTLDVWIDSGVSHQAVLRRRPELHYPADLYLEATDQHRGWFQSSLMTAVAIEGGSPYRTCLTHGFVVDVDTREKISKSAQGGYQKPTEAMHFVEKSGADLVRLWVSSVNFTDDVPFSEEMFNRLGDTYRRIRNTLRILLGNLHDHSASSDAAPTTVDRWILARLAEVEKTCVEAYAAYEFHRVYHALNQFCAVDLSSLYVDITKDRMYCDAPGSKRRRATQDAMHEVLSSLTRLLAPILAFTAEEAWGYFHPGDSVHLQSFPAPRNADPAALAEGSRLLELRAIVSQALEKARADKVITNNLEARVTLQVADPAWIEAWKPLAAELEEFFILSELVLESGPSDSAQIVKTASAKCARCWRHRPSVGKHPAHPALCDRCADAVG
ncbi:MAG: isoleucine--tRNA ligase [Chthoniobacterales bacterium]|nr:isoleucine--tRNA ligase [Chthoniobacterales bacterium]